MAKTRKVIDLNIDGTHLVCIEHLDHKKADPYRIYRIASGHRRQLVRYSDFMSVLYFLVEFFRDGMDAMTLSEQLETIKKQTCNG